MPFLRFLTYSLHYNRPVRVLLDTVKYVNLTVISMDDNGFVGLKAGRKTPLTIPYSQVLAVSYARGDSGDTTPQFFQSRKEDSP